MRNTGGERLAVTVGATVHVAAVFRTIRVYDGPERCRNEQPMVETCWVRSWWWGRFSPW